MYHNNNDAQEQKFEVFFWRKLQRNNVIRSILLELKLVGNVQTNRLNSIFPLS